MGERFFNPLLGSRVDDYLFDLNDGLIENSLESEIRNVINNFEPRVTLRSVVVNTFPDSNEVDVTISYDIVGLSIPLQNINFILQPTRY